MAASDRFARNLIEHTTLLSWRPEYRDHEVMCRADNLPVNHRAGFDIRSSYNPYPYTPPRYFNIFAETKRLLEMEAERHTYTGNYDDDPLYAEPDEENIRSGMSAYNGGSGFLRHVAWSQWGWPMGEHNCVRIVTNVDKNYRKDLLALDSSAVSWRELNKPIFCHPAVIARHHDTSVQERHDYDQPPHVPMFHPFAQDHMLRLIPCPLPDDYQIMSIPLTNPYKFTNTLLPERRLKKIDRTMRLRNDIGGHHILRDELSLRYNSVNVHHTLSDCGDIALPTTDMRTVYDGDVEGEEEGKEKGYLIRPHDKLRRPLDLHDDVDSRSVHHRKDLDEFLLGMRFEHHRRSKHLVDDVINRNCHITEVEAEMKKVEKAAKPKGERNYNFNYQPADDGRLALRRMSRFYRNPAMTKENA